MGDSWDTTNGKRHRKKMKETEPSIEEKDWVFLFPFLGLYIVDFLGIQTPQKLLSYNEKQSE